MICISRFGLETCIGLKSSTEDHAETDRRTLADSPLLVVPKCCVVVRLALCDNMLTKV